MRDFDPPRQREDSDSDDERNDYNASVSQDAPTELSSRSKVATFRRKDSDDEVEQESSSHDPIGLKDSQYSDEENKNTERLDREEYNAPVSERKPTARRG